MLIMLGIGCSSGRDCYSRLTPREELRECSAAVHFQYGKPNRFLDTLQLASELPARLMFGGRLKVDHNPTEETCQVLTDYLQENELSDVPVLVNCYDPIGQWRRLRESDRVEPAWRYTAGTVNWIAYTLIPGRVICRDSYNPFTDTLSINSGRLSDSLHAAAYAKDVQNRERPGSYAVVNSLPGVSLWKTTIAVNDVIAYARAKDSWQLESGVYRDQYPQVAVKTMAPAGYFLTPIGNIALALSGGAVGYAVGRTVENQRIAERNAEVASSDVGTDSQMELIGYAELENSAPRGASQKIRSGKHAVNVRTSEQDDAESDP